MVYCSSCGTQATNDELICRKCGTRILRVPENKLSTDDIITENPSDTIQQVSSKIPLASDEHILWHKESSRGLIHKEVMVEEAITNKRCLKYDVPAGQIIAQIGFNHLPQIVVIN